MEKELLYHGAMLYCTYGRRESYLKVTDERRITLCDTPVVTEDQAVGGVNIFPFGSGCDHPAGQKTCRPQIIGNRWLLTEPNYLVNGKHAVTMMSACFCTSGGMVYPYTTGQGDLDPDDILSRLDNRLLRALLGEIDESWLLLGFALGKFRADPINICNGNFVAQKTDLQIKGSYPLALKRTYNALDTRVSALGRGWRHSGFPIRHD